MSAVNEINAVVIQSGSSANAPKSERGDAAQARASDARQLQEAQEASAKSVVEQASPNTLRDAVSAINAQVQRVSQNLKFSVDQDSGRVVVKVVDGETDQVIRQIPSEEALAISNALDKLQGLIIQQKA